MVYQIRYFVSYHLRELILSALAEANADNVLSRCMRARSKLRLITMSNDELLELAKYVAYPSGRSAEMIFTDYKKNIEEYKQTVSEWIKDLQMVEKTDRCVQTSENGPSFSDKNYRSSILIVENEPLLREKLISVFKQSVFDVSDASGYSQARQYLNKFKVNLIIMESLLPDWDGFEACYEFRNRLGIPVILLGQDSDDDVWNRVMNSNAEHYEIKPCKYLALVARARAILRRFNSRA